jgi:hypothetical protein
MHACAAAGAAFLVAVLWFDLMFDAQTRRGTGAVLPAEVLASIGGYYRRVTTEATPMNRLISVVMLAMLAAIVAGIVRGDAPPWIGWISLAAALCGIGLAAARTVRNAVRIGAGADAPEALTRLARQVYGDHVFCLAAMSLVVVLQLAAGLLARG